MTENRQLMAITPYAGMAIIQPWIDGIHFQINWQEGPSAQAAELGRKWLEDEGWGDYLFGHIEIDPLATELINNLVI